MIGTILKLIPDIMIIGDDIIKCIEGDCTEAEWNKAVDDMYNMATKIPEVQGILAIFQIASYVAKTSFPFVDGFINTKSETDSKKMKSIRAKVSKTTNTDLIQAERTVKFFDEVTAKIAKKKNVKLPKPDTSWTESFFEENR